MVIGTNQAQKMMSKCSKKEWNFCGGQRQEMMSDYTQYYDPHVHCEWCGVLTRGRIYDTKPDTVFCGSCHNPLRPLNAEENAKTSKRQDATTSKRHDIED
jgi:hypothetical protein